VSVNQDLVVTVPLEDNDQGAAHILFGSNTGITTSGSRFVKQGLPGVAGTPEDNDFFGLFGVAIGNFDGLGNAEIAVGVTNEDFGNVENAGAVVGVYFNL
jgi:hypothetical protein